MRLLSGLKKIYSLYDRLSLFLDIYLEKSLKFLKEKFSNPVVSVFIYIAVFILLSLIAGFRKPGIDRDWLGYDGMIKTLLGSGDFWLRTHEISFSVIVHFADKVLQSPVTGTFLIYAILGIGIKLFVIRKYSKMPVFSIFAYICIFYVLWDMTQIRVSVAAAIFLFAVSDITERKPASYFLKAAVAILFHHSALVMIPFYFLKPQKPVKYLYMIIPVIAVIIGYFDIGTIILKHSQNLFPPNIAARIDLYTTVYPGGSRPLAPYYISKIIILYYCLFFLDRFKEDGDYISLKSYAWAMVLFYIFYPLSVISNRICGLLC